MDPSLVRALVGSLESMEAGFAAFAGRLEAGAAHEHAFGKLVDAAKVRDAYHDRLPATLTNLAEAAQVAREFLDEFAAPSAQARAAAPEPGAAVASAAADTTGTDATAPEPGVADASAAADATGADATAPVNSSVPPQREARE